MSLRGKAKRLIRRQAHPGWPRLRIVQSGVHGKTTRVYLNDADLSPLLSSVTVDLDCTKPTSVVLRIPAALVDLDLPDEAVVSEVYG